MPKTNAREMFLFFYKNRFRGNPISNPWDRNLGKLLCPVVFMDIDLVKALVKSYNPAIRAFHRQDKSILCSLDKNTFIQVFGLVGSLSVDINTEELNDKFERHPGAYTKKVIFKHILPYMLKVGDIPKHVKDSLTMEHFKRYFQYMVFSLNKILGIDGTMNIEGGLYIISIDI